MTKKYLLLSFLFLNLCHGKVFCQFTDTDLYYEELNGKVKSVKIKSFFSVDSTLDFTTALLNYSKHIGSESETQYDEYGKKIKEEIQYYKIDSTLSESVTINWTYNLDGNLVEEKSMYLDSRRNNTVNFTYTLDEQNRIIEIHKLSSLYSTHEVEEIEYTKGIEIHSLFIITDNGEKVKRSENHIDSNGNPTFYGSFNDGALTSSRIISYNKKEKIEHIIINLSEEQFDGHYIEFAYDKNGNLSKQVTYDLTGKILDSGYKYQKGNKSGFAFLYETKIEGEYLLQTRYTKRRSNKIKLPQFTILDKYRNEILVYTPNRNNKESRRRLYIRDITYYE